MNDALEQIVNRLEPFTSLNVSARARIARNAVLRRFDAGETLWLTGDTPRGFYVIVEGCVRIVRGTGGRQHVVHAEGSGATIGEVPLFDGGTYPATAVAAEPTHCLFVPRDTLLAAMGADPQLAWELLSRLGRRVRGLVDQLYRTTLWTVRSRLAAYLMARSADTGGSRTITLGSPQTTLAEELGTVREVLARELATLRGHGVIRTVGRGKLEILKPEALSRLAGGDDVLTRRPT